MNTKMILAEWAAKPGNRIENPNERVGRLPSQCSEPLMAIQSNGYGRERVIAMGNNEEELALELLSCEGEPVDRYGHPVSW